MMMMMIMMTTTTTTTTMMMDLEKLHLFCTPKTENGRGLWSFEDSKPRIFLPRYFHQNFATFFDT